MTAHRFNSSRPPADVTGIRRSGLTWRDINGSRILPMDEPKPFPVFRISVLVAGVVGILEYVF